MHDTNVRVAIVLLAALACAAPRNSTSPPPTPAVDHHQHLFSPRIIALSASASGGIKEISVHDLVAMLDSAGIRRAVVLSIAYQYGSVNRTVEDEYAKVRAENDWTGAQVALYPDRLVAFCSTNPLKPYALDEIARCARDPNLRRGLKLHFGNADVRLEDSAHVEQLRRVFRAANQHRMPIVVHMRANISRDRPYGAAQARVFIEQLLPLVPDVDVQIAHMAGTGPGYDDPRADSAMASLAEAVERRDPRMRRVIFDVASSANVVSPGNAALLVRRIRQVGVDRIVFGSDAASPGNLRPREAWTAFRKLPLTEGEFARIASNVAPYLR